MKDTLMVSVAVLLLLNCITDILHAVAIMIKAKIESDSIVSGQAFYEIFKNTIYSVILNIIAVVFFITYILDRG